MRLSIIQLPMLLVIVMIAARAAAEDSLQSLSGEWDFENHRYEQFSPDGENANDETDLAVPWFPKCELRLQVDPAVKTVSGTLRAKGVTLQIDGHVDVGAKTSKPLISGFITSKASASSNPVTYKFKGYVITNDYTVIVGTMVLCHGQDIANESQPVGTAAMFYAIKKGMQQLGPASKAN